MNPEQFSSNKEALLLTQLRNDLIHFEPEWVEHATEENDEGLSKLAQGLKGRFAINPLTGAGNPFYPAKCLGHGCVQWAVQSSIQFTDDFYNRLGMKIRYEHVRDRLGTEVDHDRRSHGT